MRRGFKGFLNIIIISSMIIMNLSACKGYQKVSAEDEQIKARIKIGIAIYDSRDDFIQSVYHKIKHYAKLESDAGHVEIELKLVSGENNQEIQNQQIEALIDEGYQAIAVNIVDRAQASTIIDKAKKANVPLVFFNREPVPQDMAMWEKVYYVGANAEQSGKLQAEILMNAIARGVEVDRNEDGVIQYVMLEGEPGHQDAILRTHYSIAVLEDNGYKVENIASDTGMWRKAESKEKMLEWLDEYGHQIEVVIANNDAMALGALEAMEEKGYFDNETKIQVIGVDGMEEAIAAIKKGRMLGTVINNADKQGKAVLAKLYTMVTGKEANTIQNVSYDQKCYHTDYDIFNNNYLNE